MRTDLLRRSAPLTGVLGGALTLAGDLVIGPFPEASTPADRLPAFYAAHASHVALGGALLGWGALFVALFGITVADRVRRDVPPALLWTLVVGTAVMTTFALVGAAQCALLGEIGTDPHLSPAALQAWQVGASQFGSSGGIVLLLGALFVAGVRYRAFPRWLAWSGLLLAVVQLWPVELVAFLASLVFLFWVAVAGVVLAVRPSPRGAAPTLSADPAMLS
jgi:hypothetical protein